nr:MAG TPA: hypothetical protein [Caudoviricetes sp.]
MLTGDSFPIICDSQTITKCSFPITRDSFANFLLKKKGGVMTCWPLIVSLVTGWVSLAPAPSSRP